MNIEYTYSATISNGPVFNNVISLEQELEDGDHNSEWMKWAVLKQAKCNHTVATNNPDDVHVISMVKK